MADKEKFDPEGDGYDYESAISAGILPDETGHWPSRVPSTGQILKGKKHPTFYKTVEGEAKAGFEIYKGKDGKYYSRENEKLKPSGNIANLSDQDLGTILGKRLKASQNAVVSSGNISNKGGL